MKKSFRLKDITALSAFSALLFASTNSLAFNTTDPGVQSFTYLGTTYQVTTVTGTYAQVSSQLSATPWFGNATMAINLEAIYKSLGYAPNYSSTYPIYTPYAVYGTSGSNAYYKFSAIYVWNSGAPVSNPTTDNGLWGISLTNSAVWLVLVPGPSVADTQASLNALAPKLRSYYTTRAIASNYANMNTYDCDLFDDKGLCVSVGGQQTYVDNPSANQTSGVLTVGYKVSPKIRIGGFLNQSINNNTVSGVHISNANPLMGLFAVWNQNEDHLGYRVKIANAYQDSDVTTTRDVFGSSEAGKGSTTLNTQSYVGELSYAFLANEDKTLVRPYAAVRYTRIKQDGYTETGVSTPLTYAALSDRSTAALVGVKLDHKLADNFHVKGSLGVEQDIYHYVDNLTATGVSGLASESFNDNIKRTRPVASIGAYFTPTKRQRITADLYYQQLPFQSTGSTTAYVNYMIGF